MSTGSNTYGQLATSSAENAVKPVPVFISDASGEPIKEIAAGAFHSLILLESGDVYAAGRNQHGQLGTGSTSAGRNAPQKVLSGVKAVAAGYAHSVFLKMDGTVWTAGLNSAGQLGDGGNQSQASPVEVFRLGDDNATGVAAGYDFTYIMTSKTVLYAMGQNVGGQLGINGVSRQSIPANVAAGVMAIAAGESHGVYVDTDNKLWATGANFDGQFGDSANQRVYRFKSTGNVGVTRVAAGGDSTCIAQDGPLKCMGSNRYYQLGLEGQTTVNTATAVSSVTHTEGIAVSDFHSFFVDFDRVMVTGSNAHDQLGLNNSNAEVTTPAELFKQDGVGTRAPTPAPTPMPETIAPTPSPSTLAPEPNSTVPTENPTRNPLDTSNDGLPWWALVGLGSGAMVAVGGFVRMGVVGDKDDAVLSSPAQAEGQEVDMTDFQKTLKDEYI